MDLGWAILIIGFAALVAAFLLLVIGLVYSELMNSDIPRGVANRRKLHMVHGLFVGIAIVVSSYSIIGIVDAYYFKLPAITVTLLCLSWLHFLLLNEHVTCLCLCKIKNIYIILGLCQKCLSFLCPLITDKAWIREILDKKSSVTKVQTKARSTVAFLWCCHSKYGFLERTAFILTLTIKSILLFFFYTIFSLW